MRELISVIVPIYNTGKYLNHCIQSILNQTYSNLELILVNDGSTDDSGKICDEWKLKDSRIKVIHQENKGLSEARNIGLDMASGEYIGFVDSDDYIHSRMYEVLYSEIQKNTADISICQEYAFYEDAEPFEEIVKSDYRIIPEDGEQFLYHFFDDYTAPLVCVWNKLYKRECIEGIKFRAGKRAEDCFFMVEVANQIQKVVWVKERMYFCRIREDSIMATAGPYFYQCFCEALMFQYEFLKNGRSESFEERLLCKSLNTMADNYARTANRGNKEVAEEIRRQLVYNYKREISKIKNRKMRLKLGLARYSPFVYRNLKKLYVNA